MMALPSAAIGKSVWKEVPGESTEGAVSALIGPRNHSTWDMPTPRKRAGMWIVRGGDLHSPQGGGQFALAVTVSHREPPSQSQGTADDTPRCASRRDVCMGNTRRTPAKGRALKFDWDIEKFPRSDQQRCDGACRRVHLRTARSENSPFGSREL